MGSFQSKSITILQDEVLEISSGYMLKNVNVFNTVEQYT